MSRSHFRIFAAIAIVAIAVTIIIIKTRKNEFDKIEAAVPGWLGSNGCAKIEVSKPSLNTAFVRWVGTSANTATIDCEYVSGFLDYARFSSSVTLNQALHLRPIPEKLCVTGRTALMDSLIDQAEGPGRFYKMCHNLHGTLYPAAASQTIVDPTKVPGQLAKASLHIVYHRGFRPTGFTSAIYGTASDSHGVSIHFGFFFVNNTDAPYPESSLRFVSGATGKGSASGRSYVEVTSAGSRRGVNSPKAREEFRMAHELRRAVAELAPASFEGETF